MRRFTTAFVAVSLCLLPAAAVHGTEGEPTDWGTALGRVYDSDSNAPIAQATVTVQNDGVFAESGKTVSNTDKTGRYKCEAELGKVKKSLHLGRALLSSPGGILFGSAKKVTRRVEVSRLNIRVSADGYHPFEGVVKCRTIDADKFDVTMEPILLTPVSSPDVSTVAEHWSALRMLEVKVDPPIARLGQDVTVTARVKCPPVGKLKLGSGLFSSSMPDITVSCFSMLFGPKDLKQVETPKEGEAVFSRTFRVEAPEGYEKLAKSYGIDVAAPRSPADFIRCMVWSLVYDTGLPVVPAEAAPQTIMPSVTSSALLLPPGGLTRHTGTALFQVALSDEDEKVARLRLDAYNSYVSGRYADATAKLKELCARPGVSSVELAYLAGACEFVHDYDGAVNAWKRVVDLTPEDRRLHSIASYSSALVASGQPDKAISELAPAVERVKEKDRPKKVPIEAVLTLGKAYLQAAELDEAKSINERLLKWPYANFHAGVVEFRRALRLAAAEAALKANPNGAQALADYGRVLADLGRWEEAVDRLRAASAADPSLSAVRYDLGYALMRLQGAEAAKQSFEEALAEAEKQVVVGDQKSKDFFAWHRLGKLLYRKSCLQKAASDAAAAETLNRCREALTEALKVGLKGAEEWDEFSPMFGYTGPKEVTIAGFAYPEATEDFVVLDSLRILEKQPGDYLSHFNLATALHRLGQNDLAREALDKSTQLRPDFLEGKCLSALIAKQEGETRDAMALLSDIVKSNPRHPEANLALAELHTAEGNIDAAASCLALHAKTYGDSRGY